MTTKSWIFYIIASILSVVMLASAILMCIPSTQQAIADKIATNLSPAYAEMKDDNENKDSQISDLTSEIDTLNKTITDKDASITAKNKQIAEKDSLISSQTEQLNTCNSNIQTLNTQKAGLLTAVTEIDNKINSTTDSVELDDLEIRKTAILAQIDTLNTQIATLTQEKTQLTQEIATLTQEKADLQAEVTQLESDKAELQKIIDANENDIKITKVVDHYECSGGDCVDGEWSYDGCYLSSFSFSQNVVRYYHYVNYEYYFDSVLKQSSKMIIPISQEYFDCELRSEGLTLTYSQFRELRNEVVGFVGCRVFSDFSNKKLIVDFYDKLYSGKFVAEDGSYFDFDNLESSFGWGTSDSRNFVYKSGTNVFLWFGGGAEEILFFDENSFTFIDGTKFTKVTDTTETDTTETTFYANELYKETDAGYYKLICENENGTFSYTDYFDDSKDFSYSVTAGVLNIENKTLQFKVDGSDELQYLFTNVEVTELDEGSEYKYQIISATYNDGTTDWTLVHRTVSENIAPRPSVC
jgi:predicted  nucleic acid-binding Zn-ribbon protein